jgi:hypothetical protein
MTDKVYWIVDMMILMVVEVYLMFHMVNLMVDGMVVKVFLMFHKVNLMVDGMFDKVYWIVDSMMCYGPG